MAETAASGGLMTHQKDEHDIWICKDCGWKYPNAKPSPKIRKNHKKHCPGHAIAAATPAGGSSDEASDDEHHSSLNTGHDTKSAPVIPAVELKSRSFDFASSAAERVISDDIPTIVVDGDAKAAGHDETPVLAEKQVVEMSGGPDSEKVEHEVSAVSTGGLMPHQKDEHDIWMCKECGWKYPNARPSPKIRKNHKKHCSGHAAGTTAAPVAGGSSDEASEDEHHSLLKDGPSPIAATEIPLVESTPRSFDAAAFAKEKDLHEEPALEVVPTSAASNGNAKEAHHVEATATVENDERAKAESGKAFEEVTVSAGGLMPHQKDEHDVWICKECGWKYPNAKPSPKIRRNHKKHCPGKDGAAGGSSDEASDDEHLLQVPSTPAAIENGSATEAPNNTSRDIDFAALKESTSPELKHESVSVETAPSAEGPSPTAAPDIAVAETTHRSLDAPSFEKEKELSPEIIPASTASSGNAEEASHVVHHATAEKDEQPKPDSQKTVQPATGPVGGLMVHQKDEHDIWVCKVCGWKYPNAKPSPKIKRNHKKHCPGKGGAAGATGGSSDEASDDEHHLHAAITEGPATEAPVNTSREIDFADLKDSTSPACNNEVVLVETSTPPAEEASHDVNGTREFVEEKEPVTPEVKSEEVPVQKVEDRIEPRSTVDSAVTVLQTDSQETGVSGEESGKEGATLPIESTEAPQPAAGGGLMLHQKDENDIWTCKDCGWKYPNAKPSAKIRKTHKKRCTGKSGDAATVGGSSDEASDDDHHPPAASPVAARETAEEPILATPAIESGEADSVPATEEFKVVSTDRDFKLLVETSNPEMEHTNTPIAVETPPEDSESATLKDAETLAVESSEPRSFDTGALSLQEAIQKETVEDQEEPAKPLSLQEAIEKESKQEKELLTKSELAAIAAHGGLMPHQKDETDIWVCKECGWKYPNSKPSPKIRNSHKKKCPGNSSAAPAAGEGSGGEGADDEEHSITESKDGSGGLGVGDTSLKSREFSLSSEAPKPEAGVAASENELTKLTEPEGATNEADVGGLMPHQKDEEDIWLCKECGWRYPNAKPSAKIRNNHKKKCPARATKGKGGSSGDGSSDDDKKGSGKCFPCLLQRS